MITSGRIPCGLYMILKMLLVMILRVPPECLTILSPHCYPQKYWQGTDLSPLLLHRTCNSILKRLWLQISKEENIERGKAMTTQPFIYWNLFTLVVEGIYKPHQSICCKDEGVQWIVADIPPLRPISDASKHLWSFFGRFEIDKGNTFYLS